MDSVDCVIYLRSIDIKFEMTEAWKRHLEFGDFWQQFHYTNIDVPSNVGK